MRPLCIFQTYNSPLKAAFLTHSDRVKIVINIQLLVQASFPLNIERLQNFCLLCTLRYHKLSFYNIAISPCVKHIKNSDAQITAVQSIIINFARIVKNNEKSEHRSNMYLRGNTSGDLLD